MTLQLIPAIDLKNGECVRLRQGVMDDATVYSSHPPEMAAQWVEQGASRLHLVDLDGAFAGQPRNADVITQICRNHPDMPVQVGGGIRELETIEGYLKTGVQYCIIGSKAVQEPEFIDEACKAFPGHIIVGLDARDGMVATEGWAETSSTSATDLAKRFADAGVSSIVYTDIARDGMLSGVNVEATAALAEASGIPVIASGGMRDLDDIRQLMKVVDRGVCGAILGRSIYEGTLDLREAEALVNGST